MKYTITVDLGAIDLVYNADTLATAGLYLKLLEECDGCKEVKIVNNTTGVVISCVKKLSS